MDTPVCALHCENSDHPRCASSSISSDGAVNGNVWGYHVMECTSCVDTFCRPNRWNNESPWPASVQHHLYYFGWNWGRRPDVHVLDE